MSIPHDLPPDVPKKILIPAKSGIPEEYRVLYLREVIVVC
jgi:hypothetical protein